MKILLWFFITLIVIAPSLDFLDITFLSPSLLSSYVTYLSVAITPIIALYAYLGVVKSLKLHDAELKQIYIENQKQEIVRCLDKYEILIKESLLNHGHNFTTEISGQNYNLYQIMTGFLFETAYENHIKPYEYYSQKSEVPKTFEENIMFDAIATTSVYVVRISEYIKKYQSISDENFIVGFYYSKYAALTKRLFTLGYISQETYDFWEQKLNHS